MEGASYLAGPWFTVLNSSSDWNRIADLDLSDGTRTIPAHVEIRLLLTERTLP